MIERLADVGVHNKRVTNKIKACAEADNLLGAGVVCAAEHQSLSFLCGIEVALTVDKWEVISVLYVVFPLSIFRIETEQVVIVLHWICCWNHISHKVGDLSRQDAGFHWRGNECPLAVAFAVAFHGDDDVQGHIVCAVEENAVLVCFQRAVVMHKAAEVGRGGSVGVRLPALVGWQVVYSNEVAVVDIGFVVHAGEGVVKHACVHAAWYHERILDGRYVCYGPTDETAAIDGTVGGGKGAVEHAAFNHDVVTTSGKSCHNSAMGAVTTDAAVDGYRAAAVGDVQRARRPTHDATCKFCAGGDSAIDVQVLNNGISSESEWCGTFSRCVITDSQRVAIAVERALERGGLVAARHR